MPDPKLRMERHRKLKIDRKEAHDTGDLRLHLKVKRSKVKVTRLDRKSAISSEREGLRTSNLVYEWNTMTCITDMRGDLKVKGQGYDVTSSVWRVFAHNSTKRQSTKIGRKVVRATSDIVHQFQGQNIEVIRPLWVAIRVTTCMRRAYYGDRITGRSACISSASVCCTILRSAEANMDNTNRARIRVLCTATALRDVTVCFPFCLADSSSVRWRQQSLSVAFLSTWSHETFYFLVSRSSNICFYLSGKFSFLPISFNDVLIVMMQHLQMTHPVLLSFLLHCRQSTSACIIHHTYILHTFIHTFNDTCITECIIDYFWQSPWSLSCCIRLFKFVIITLHCITFTISNTSWFVFTRAT